MGFLMKKIFFAVAIPFILNACSSAPIVAKPNQIQSTLKSVQSVSVSLPSEEVKSRVEFAMTGYTIIGVLYVAGAVQMMDKNSAEMQAFYDKYVLEHPGVLSIKDAFNNELKKKMDEHGSATQYITIGKLVSPSASMHVGKPLSQADRTKYTVDANAVKSQLVVVVDGLTGAYYAKTSSDSYHPLLGVTITILNANDTYEKPTSQELVAVQSPLEYADFNALKIDSERAYLALIDNSVKLADKVADKLYK
jgi:hypothetical protein